MAVANTITIVCMTGFEGNYASTGLGEDGWLLGAGTAGTIETSIVKRGSQSMKCAAVSSGGGSMQGFSGIDADAGTAINMALGDGVWGYVQWWAYIDDVTPAANLHFCRIIWNGASGTGTPTYVTLKTNGKVQTTDNATPANLIGSESASAPFTVNTWHNIRVGARRNGNDVEVKVWVDDLTTEFYSMSTTPSSPVTSLSSFRVGAIANKSENPNTNIYVDEAILFNLTGSGNTLPTEDIETLTTVAGDTDDQTYNDFTHVYNAGIGDSSGTEWHTQDDSSSNAGTVGTANDGNSSYATRPSLNTAEIKQTYRMRNPSHPSGKVAVAMQPCAVAINFSGSGGDVTILVREGSSDVDSSGKITLGTAYRGHTEVLNAKPSGGVWTNSAVDDVQIGLHGTANASPRVPRLTKTLMVVAYMTEVATGTEERRRLLPQVI